MVLHSECVPLQGARECSCRVQVCVLIEQFGSLAKFLCSLAKRLDVTLEEE